MKKTANRKTPPFIWILPAILVALAAACIALKIHVRDSGPSGPPADGTAFRIFVTGGLNCYREPCG